MKKITLLLLLFTTFMLTACDGDDINKLYTIRDAEVIDIHGTASTIDVESVKGNDPLTFKIFDSSQQEDIKSLFRISQTLEKPLIVDLVVHSDGIIKIITLPENRK